MFSSFAFLGGPGWAYSRGAAAYYIIAYGVIGMVPLYFFGPRARRLGERFGFVTQAELLARRYKSRALSVLLAVLSVAVFLPYLTLQMKGAGLILSTITGGRVSFAVGAGVAIAIVLFIRAQVAAPVVHRRSTGREVRSVRRRPATYQHGWTNGGRKAPRRLSSG